MRPRFRRARVEDAEAVAQLIHDASPTLSAYSFGIDGADPRDVFRHDFRNGDGLYGKARLHVATTEDDEVIATLTAYPGPDAPRLTLRTARAAFAVLGPRRAAIATGRALATASLFVPPRGDGLFLLNLCIAPRFRGRGLLRPFLEHVVAVSTHASTRVVELDVDTSNTRGENAFRRLGFEEVAVRPYRGSYPGLAGFRRMRRVVRPDASAP